MTANLYRGLALTLLLLLGGCASEPTGDDGLERLALTPKGPEVDLDGVSAPEQAGPYRLQGRVRSPERETLLFRYTLPDAPERQLDITVYPLPPGWQDMPHARAVSGHYGQIRQALTARVLKRQDARLESVEEKLRDDVAGHTVAEGVLLQSYQARTRLVVLQVAISGPTFVRVTASAPEAVGQEHIRDARKVLAAFLAAQSSK